MTLRELADGVLEHFNYSTDGASEARSRVIRHINEWHKRILTRPGFERCRQASTTFASVASTPTVVLPPAVTKILRVYDPTNRITLEERFFDWYRFAEPSPTSHTGTPYVWVPMGYAACAALGEATGTGLWVVSSSASDTTAKVYLEGVRLGGHVWSDSVTLNGTTRAQIGSLTDWVEVTKLTLDMSSVGAVSLYKVATVGTAYAAIAVGETQARYLQIGLWPTPSGAVTYYLDYQRQLRDLVHEADQPLLPEDAHWVLGLAARVNEYERTDDKRLAWARGDLEKAIGETRLSMASRDVVVPARTTVRMISRVNGWSPADTVVR